MRALPLPGHALGRLARRLDRLSDQRFAIVASLPGLLLVAVVVLPPILAVLGMSLFRIEPARDDRTPFIGLNNFLLRLPADPDVMGAIPRTIVFAALTTLVTVPLALMSALLLHRGGRGSAILGAVLLLPWAVAPVVTGVFWRFIFTSKFGLATNVAAAAGLDPPNWLESTATSIAIGINATAWRSVPLIALLLLAALKQVPSAQFRAARMDGAGAWQTFRYVTLPSILPVLTVATILQVILSMQVFDVLFKLTGGGPGRDTFVLVYAIYESAFKSLSFGFASAVTVVLFLLILGCSLLVVLLRRRRRASAPLVSETVVSAASATPVVRPKGPLATVPLPPRPTGPPSATRLRVAAARRSLGSVARVAVLGTLVLWLVGPIVWIAIASLQYEGSLTSVPLSLGLQPNLDGYTTLLGDPRWLHSLWVSLQLVAATTFLALVIGALAAYPLSRYRIPGQRAIVTVLALTQMVPAIVLVIPVLLMFQTLRLKDTVASLVIVNVAFWIPLVVWLLKNVFDAVPRSMESAARMDGCTRLRTLFSVTLPAARPGVAAVAVLLIIGTWNEFLFAMILGDREAVTVTRWIGFIESFTTAGLTRDPPYHLLATAGILTTLPCLVLALVFQRQIMSGLTEGHLKG